jgi:Zn-dependent protease
VCDGCDALVYSDRLEQIATQAKELETKSEFRPARELWLQALPLLPEKSVQAEWIRNHAYALLGMALDKELPQKENKWVGKLGPLGPILVVLAKSKGLLTALFNLKFLLSFFLFAQVSWALFGLKFGVGLAVLILVHEMGHFIDIKRRGLPVDMPVFLPGFGAYVRWKALGVSEEVRAEVSLAGPMAGFFGSFVCAIVWWKTGNNFWLALARFNACLNVLNLLPIWVLDGGQAALALNKTGRIILLTAALALWLVLGEGIFFLVAAAGGYRLFTKDLSRQPNTIAVVYYVAVLVCLGILLHFVPGQGFGIQ